MRKLIKKTMDSQPRLNPVLTEGMVYHHQHEIEATVDRLMRCAAESFPKGLRYVREGVRRATPEEHFMDNIRSRNEKNINEITKSDMFMCRYELEFTDKNNITHKLNPRYLKLPFFRLGGICRIRDTANVISPVLSDGAMSVEPDRIFIPFNRVRLNFYSLNHPIVIDGEIRHLPVTHSAIHTGAKKGGKRRTCNMHYLMAIHGLADTMREHFNTNIVVVEGRVDREKYPEEEYVLVETTGLDPAGRRRSNYMATDLRVLVPRPDANHETLKAVAGFFYVVDFEPDAVFIDDLDNPRLWRRILMRFVDTKILGEAKAQIEMDTHIDSVVAYMDDIILQRMRLDNLPIKSTADALSYTVKHFSLLTATCEPNNLYGRSVEVISPLLYQLVKTISVTMFRLQREEAKPAGLTVKSIERTLNHTFKTDCMMQLDRLGMSQLLNTATDCLPLGVTRNIVPQANSSASGEESAFSNLTHHASMTVYSAFLAITKTNPILATPNHFMKLDRRGYPLITKEHRRRLDYGQSGLDV